MPGAVRRTKVQEEIAMTRIPNHSEGYGLTVAEESNANGWR
jgi:hypothetical protein